MNVAKRTTWGVVLAALVLTGSAQAQNTSVFNKAYADVATAANWTPSGVPRNGNIGEIPAAKEGYFAAGNMYTAPDTAPAELRVLTNASLFFSVNIAANHNVVLDGGKIRAQGTPSLVYSGATFLKSDSTMERIFLRGPVQDYDASHAGKLIKIGTFDCELAADNTFTGGLEIDNGKVYLGHAGALNSNTANTVAFASNANTKELHLCGFSVTLASLSTGPIVGSALVRSNPTVFYGGRVLAHATLTISNMTDCAYAGTFDANHASYDLNLVKSGTGTLTLSGASSVNWARGSRTVNQGTLVVGHTNALGTGGTIAINSNGTLAIGSGVTFTRGVTFNAGSALGGSGVFQTNAAWTLPAGFTVRPGLGTAPGTLTVNTGGNALTFGDARTLEIDFDAANVDCLAITGGGTLTLNGTTDTLVLRGTPKRGMSYTIAEATAVSGTFKVLDTAGLTVSGGKVVYESDKVRYVTASGGTLLQIR